MKIKISNCILLFLLISGCKDNGTPTSPSLNPDDAIRQLLVGDWVKDHYQLTLNADGSFVENSLYVIQYYLKPVDTLTVAMSGSYSVENSIVDFSNVQFYYRTSSGNSWPGFQFGSSPLLLHINGDSLQITPANVFTRVSSSVSPSQLEGTWRSLTWQLFLGSDSIHPSNVSRLELVYDFKSDTSIFSKTWNLLDLPMIPVYTDYGYYQYIPPTLKTCIFTDTSRVRVAFKSSKMYWFYDENTWTLLRLK